MTDFFELSADAQATLLTGLARSQLHHWGEATELVRLIKFRENAVFEIQLARGERAALRVHRQGYHSRASLDAELEWMQVLTDAGLRVPRAIPTEQGALVQEANLKDVPGVWLMDMLAWIDGDMLGEVGEPLPIDPEQIVPVFENLGRAMAQMHLATCAWPQANQQPRHHWNAAGFVGESPVWGRFWELAALTSEQSRFFDQIRAVLATDLADYDQFGDHYGLIHADLVPENVLRTESTLSLIDFDDAGYGWFVFDIVTALYWLQEEPQFDQIHKALLAGYQQVRPLREVDLDAMGLFFALRSTTYLGWAHTRQNTTTAQELTPLLIELAESTCRNYLETR